MTETGGPIIVRLSLKNVMQIDGDFVDVIVLYTWLCPCPMHRFGKSDVEPVVTLSVLQ